MSNGNKTKSEVDMGGPPPSAGIIFAMCGLGFFYGLIALVDPLL